jgi:HK97 family phage portal protein
MSILSRISSLFETKASTIGRMMRVMNLGQAAWNKRDYDRLAKGTYQLNVVGYRVIQLVARSMARVPLCLYQGGKEIEDDNHPLLARLRCPNPMEHGAAFFEKVYNYYLISGNSYIEGVGNGTEGEIGELWCHRPSRVRVVPSNIGTVAGYQYVYDGDVKRTWKVDPVTMAGPILHVKTFHPLDDWYGMAPAEAAGMSIDTHNESSEWCKSLLQNGASPSGAFVYEPEGVLGGGKLTKPQRDQLKEDIDQNMSGGKNAGRPMIIDGGLRWESMGLSPKDMDWLQGRFNTAREIAQAYGAPPQLLGIPGDNTYSNYQEARLAFFQETVIPLLELFVDAYNGWLCPAYGEDLLLKIDEDQVPALEPLRKDKWDKVSNASFLTTNEKRDALGYEELDDELADKIMVPSSMVFLDDVGAEAQAKADAIANGGAPGAPGAPGGRPTIDTPKILTLDKDMK